MGWRLVTRQGVDVAHRRPDIEPLRATLLTGCPGFQTTKKTVVGYL
jgi:hypothetical protein